MQHALTAFKHRLIVLRETVHSLISDMEKNTLSVLAHNFSCHKGLTLNIYSPYPPCGTQEVSSVLKQKKTVCYACFVHLI